MEIVLDGVIITSKKILFTTLKTQINSSDFYGDNLDALWDVFTTIEEDISITIHNYDNLKSNLGSYADSLMQLFLDLKVVKNNVIVEVKNS